MKKSVEKRDSAGIEAEAETDWFLEPSSVWRKMAILALGMTLFLIGCQASMAGNLASLLFVMGGKWLWQEGPPLGVPKSLTFGVLFFPLLTLFLGGWGILDYARGTAQLRVVRYGMYRPSQRQRIESGNLPRDLRVPLHRISGGCIPAPPWPPSEAYVNTVIWGIRTFGPMASGYLGDYPTKQEALQAIEESQHEDRLWELQDNKVDLEGVPFTLKGSFQGIWILDRHGAFQDFDAQVRLARIGTCVVARSLAAKERHILYLFEVSSGEPFARYWLGE
jgi:hypothetical protein